MIDTISIWTGRIALCGLGLFILWHFVMALWFAVRDVYTVIRNVMDAGGAGWQWLGIPWVFLEQLWKQIDARIHGYKTNVIRTRKSKSP